MIRTLSILAASPCLAGCDLNDLINPGASSRAAYEYRASITSQPNHIPDAGKMVEYELVEEMADHAAFESVYVATEPQPECIYGLYRIYDCVAGKVVML